MQTLRARSRALGGPGIAGAVLLGWLAGTMVIARWVPSFALPASTVPQFFLTSLAITLLGDEHPSRRRRIVVRALAATIVTIGVAALLARELLLAVDLETSAAPIAARLTAPTTLAFAVLGAAMVARDLDVGLAARRLVDGLVGLVSLASLVALVAHLHGIPGSTPPASHAAIANTSVGLLLACAAILVSRPSRGVMRSVMSDDTAGRFLRRTLPAVIVIPVALGAVRLLGQRSGYYDADTGLALHVLAQVACLSVIVAWNGYALFRAADARRVAMELLSENEENLRITLDSLSDGVIATDAAGRIVRMNPAAERCTGFALEEAIGKRLDAVLRVVDARTRRTVEESPFDHVSRTGSVAGLAERPIVLSRSGTGRAVLDSGAPILNRLGILRGVVLVFGDRPKHRLTRRSGR